MSGIADAIAASKAAGQRRFQHAMQAEQKRYFDRGLEDIRSELLPRIGEAQEQAETLTENVDQLRILTDIRLAGMEAKDLEFDTRLETLSNENRDRGDRLDAMRFDFDVVKNVVGRLATAMDKVAQVPGILRDPEVTAGGLISDAYNRGFTKAGVQIATGAIMLFHQWPVPGWLPCDGKEYARTTYPELADVLGNNYGAAAAGPEYFKVPTISSGSSNYIYMVRY